MVRYNFLSLCTTDLLLIPHIAECSSLDLPASEIVAQKNNTRVGAILSYSCAKGYVLIGDDEMACWYNGIAAVWDGYEYGCKKRAYSKDGSF